MATVKAGGVSITLRVSFSDSSSGTIMKIEDYLKNYSTCN